ncbi:MAG: AsmA family protein [Rhodospirillales bacterium]|nr:AsmA family protein [Rhodospirillales bacterium]
MSAPSSPGSSPRPSPRPSGGRRILRRLLFGLGALVVVAIAAVVVFVLTFNANRYKSRIEAAVRQATGRSLTLAGPITLKLSLHPTIEATDVALANPPGFSRPDLARLQALDLQLNLPALLHWTVAIDRLVLVRPDILLERLKTGAVNWHFTPLAAPAGTSPAASGSGGSSGAGQGAPSAGSSSAGAPSGATQAAKPAGAAVFVQDLRIDNGTIGYRDDRTGKQTTIALSQARLRAANPDAPLRLDATATVNGVPVALSGTTGSLAALQQPGSQPWPLRLALSAADAKLAANGTIADPAAGRGMAIALDLRIPNLAALGSLGGTALPAVKQIALTGRLTVPESVAQGASLQNLALTLPQGRVTGTLGLRMGPVPRIAGTLSSPGLDADALLAEFRGPAVGPAPSGSAPSGRAPSGPAGAAGRAKPSGAASGLVFSDAPLPFPLLRQADADLHVSVAALKSGGETVRDLAFHLVLSGGKLSVAPFTAAPPAGKLSLRLTVDAARPVPPVALVVHAPGLSLASLLTLAGQKGVARGDVAIDADLHGVGTSLHGIAAGLDGVVVATMTGGTIDNAVVNRMFGRLLAQANIPGLLTHGGSSDIRCFAMRLVARNGAARLDPFLFSSTLNTIDGSGTINLGAETLDLMMHPQGRVGGTGFAVPVRVSGHLAHPTIALSRSGTAEAGIGAALSLLGGKKVGVPQALQATGPSCASALALARGQKPPPAAAPVAAPHAAPAPTAPAQKPPNPGDLLRKLFR